MVCLLHRAPAQHDLQRAQIVVSPESLVVDCGLSFCLLVLRKMLRSVNMLEKA